MSPTSQIDCQLNILKNAEIDAQNTHIISKLAWVIFPTMFCLAVAGRPLFQMEKEIYVLQGFLVFLAFHPFLFILYGFSELFALWRPFSIDIDDSLSPSTIFKKISQKTGSLIYQKYEPINVALYLLSVNILIAGFYSIMHRKPSMKRFLIAAAPQIIAEIYLTVTNEGFNEKEFTLNLKRCLDNP